MNTSTPYPFEHLAANLIRRGLPADYAHRAASEIADHHGDLVDELRQTGFAESAALSEASRRLGEERTLVKNTVREYQSRFWCARWPLVTFVLAPLPVLLTAWTAAAWALVLASGQYVQWSGIETSGLQRPHFFAPLWMKYVCMISLFILVPSLVTYAFARLAKRAALGWRWILVAACIVGVFAGTVRWYRTGEGTKNFIMDPQTRAPMKSQPYRFAMVAPLIDPSWWYWSGFRRWYAKNPLQPLQLLVPLAAAAAVILRSRQLALRNQRLCLDGS